MQSGDRLLQLQHLHSEEMLRIIRDGFTNGWQVFGKRWLYMVLACALAASVIICLNANGLMSDRTSHGVLAAIMVPLCLYVPVALPYLSWEVRDELKVHTKDAKCGQEADREMITRKIEEHAVMTGCHDGFDRLDKNILELRAAATSEIQTWVSADWWKVMHGRGVHPVLVQMLGATMTVAVCLEVYFLAMFLQ